ncbi:MAG: hypothetical protein ACXV2I_02470 [Actinomycetes bacterium]
MRTVLSTTARRRAVTLALSAGLTVAFVVPASAATSSGKPTKHHRAGHASSAATATGIGDVRLGAAVKYVRGADGTVRRVR